MQNKKFSLRLIGLTITTIFVLSSFTVAEEAEDVMELKKQIEALQKRVEELEDEKQDSPYRLRDRFHGRFGLGWDPLEEINRMQEEMDHMFQNSFGRLKGKQGMFSSNMSFD